MRFGAISLSEIEGGKGAKKVSGDKKFEERLTMLRTILRFGAIKCKWGHKNFTNYLVVITV